MKWIAGVVLAAMVWATASAAPRAESALECGIAADMAVVAHSLAREQVQRPKAGAIMARIYDVAGSDRGRALMQDILEAAYSHNGASSQKFAEDLFATCMKRGGNMDPVLGQRL
jgi:lipopolysaccharide export LptBFGC system permease protein LptF